MSIPEEKKDSLFDIVLNAYRGNATLALYNMCLVMEDNLNEEEFNCFVNEVSTKEMVQNGCIFVN